ncbi:MAG: hypothetical protein ACOC6E_03660, partial [Thermodesulfobacteriota bacterium]
LGSLTIAPPGRACAQTGDEVRWSVDVGAVSLSEALDQSTLLTGIKIFTTTPFVHRVSPKRYMNQCIEQILKDMLKQVNYVAVWHYSKGGIESVWILTFDRKTAERHDNMEQRDQEPHPEFLESEEAFQRRDHIEETPAPEETEAEKREESEPLPLGGNEKSNRVSADLQADPAEDSPDREESRPGEQQEQREE